MDKALPNATRALSTSATLLEDVDRCPDILNELPQIRLPLVPNPRLVAVVAPASVGAEKFRMLVVRLHRLRERQQLKRLVVTSAVKGEGKSVVSANLAVTCAHRERTLLIDGDLRQSGLADLFGTHDLPGLTDWWHGESEISDFLKRIASTPLWYLPAGTGTGHALEILQSARLAEMLAHLSEWFSWIIIDSPPLMPVADPNVWGMHADGALLVIRQGKTPKRLLRRALEDAAGLKLLGVVANASQDAGLHHYAQYYGDRSRRVNNQPRQFSPIANPALSETNEP
jgi:capsular exopolysaccharide synthesis family protein